MLRRDTDKRIPKYPLQIRLEMLVAPSDLRHEVSPKWALAARSSSSDLGHEVGR